jgi:hypothetical protein
MKFINISGPGMDDKIIVSTTRTELLSLSREEYSNQARLMLSGIEDGDKLIYNNTDAKKRARALEDIEKIVYSLD